MRFQKSLVAIYSNTVNAFLQVRERLFNFQVTKNKNKFHSEDASNKNNFTQRTNKLQTPVRPDYSAPKLPIVLCHGLFGFDKLGFETIPYLQLHYWGGVQEALQKLGAKVVVTKVPGTGCIRTRALALQRILESNLHGGCELNLIAHSMGGLDCRYLITHLPTDSYSIRSLTTIGTPHRGSPFMDWCRDIIGLGKLSKSFETAEKAADHLLKELDERCRKVEQLDQLNTDKNRSDSNKIKNNSNNSKDYEMSSSLKNSSNSYKTLDVSLLSTLPQKFSSLLHTIIHAFDTPAYSNLTTDFCMNSFNPNTPNHPSVAYYSYGAATEIPIWSPLHLPYQIIKEKEGPNDGLVSVKSARWGRYVRTVECDHWDLTECWRFKLGSSNQFNPVEFYVEVANSLAKEVILISCITKLCRIRQTDRTAFGGLAQMVERSLRMR
ncbi:9706_t:CDS:2 [Entrophospora sp. SA101]|nr:9706_t:CDS:2 [Entrophospora sp. SA101]CAJ0908432.1 20185_t:CDS:2 [Entrophospora sp. SA101]